MKLEIVTPAELVFSGEVTYVSLAGAEGDFGVLPGHAPTISTLRPGVLSVTQNGNSVTKYAVAGGFADVTPAQVTILAESVQQQNTIDLAQTKEQLASAHAARDAVLQEGQGGIRLAKIEQEIDLLRVRLTLAEDWALRKH